MVDPISNVTNPREAGLNQSRPQPSPTLPGALNPETNLAPDQRVGSLQAAVEKLIKKSLPMDSKLQIEQDKGTGAFVYRSIDPRTGEVVGQWPPEKLLELREYLKEMEGVLLDKHI